MIRFLAQRRLNYIDCVTIGSVMGIGWSWWAVPIAALGVVASCVAEVAADA